MMKSSSLRAPKRAAGFCRKRRRRHGARRVEWVHSCRRAQNILDSVANLLHWAMSAATVSESRLQRLPIRTAREINAGVRRLKAAGIRILRAQKELAAAYEAFGRLPQAANGDTPESFAYASKRLTAASQYLQYVLGELVLRQIEVLAGLECGELVPERPGDDRPRIVLQPRLVQVRAFLRRRQPRVVDRIASILRRRRRTPRPAAIRVPRRSILGRAPPLSTV